MTSDGEAAQPQAAHDWFVQARRWYAEEHQGCPCCHGRHRAFRARWGSRTEYHCNECDYSAAHDALTDECAAARGHEAGASPLVFAGLWQDS